MRFLDGDRSVATVEKRDAAACGERARARLVAERVERRGVRTDEGDARGLAAPGESRVFCEEPVAGMDRVTTGLSRDGDDALAVEVGCGAGALGAAFKAICPEVVYVGLEQVEEAASRAAGRLDHVLRADAEDPALVLPDLPPLDCLIYGDVLEHLKDPWTTLRRHAALLHDEGVLLACVPNVQHWSVLANLLQGRWPLADEGLFDRTHLRWFTRESLGELVASCGLQLQELAPRIFQRERAEAFVAQLEPALAGLGVDRQRLLEGLAASIDERGYRLGQGGGFYDR
ncbi:MAG: methyltransferase domain-containing protein, partial [Deltaproteobacteria bacterium]